MGNEFQLIVFQYCPSQTSQRTFVVFFKDKGKNLCLVEFIIKVLNLECSRQPRSRNGLNIFSQRKHTISCLPNAEETFQRCKILSLQCECNISSDRNKSTTFCRFHVDTLFLEDGKIEFLAREIITCFTFCTFTHLCSINIRCMRISPGAK